MTDLQGDFKVPNSFPQQTRRRKRGRSEGKILRATNFKSLSVCGFNAKRACGCQTHLSFPGLRLIRILSITRHVSSLKNDANMSGPSIAIYQLFHSSHRTSHRGRGEHIKVPRNWKPRITPSFPFKTFRRTPKLPSRILDQIQDGLFPRFAIWKVESF